MNVPIMITLKGTQLTETGIIGSISAGEAVPGKPVEIITVLTNTGNHHYYGAYVNVTVTDSTGKEVATASTNPSIFALIPGNAMTFNIPLGTTLPVGTYTVKSEARFGTTLLDSKTVSITIGEPGTPAPTQTVSETPTQVATEAPTQAPTQAVSEVPTAPTMAVTTEESPVTPGTIATRAPLSAITIMLALAGVSGILVLRRKN
jgi:hypothetical protein